MDPLHRLQSTNFRVSGLPPGINTHLEFGTFSETRTKRTIFTPKPTIDAVLSEFKGSSHFRKYDTSKMEFALAPTSLVNLEISTFNPREFRHGEFKPYEAKTETYVLVSRPKGETTNFPDKNIEWKDFPK